MYFKLNNAPLYFPKLRYSILINFLNLAQASQRMTKSLSASSSLPLIYPIPSQALPEFVASIVENKFFYTIYLFFF